MIVPPDLNQARVNKCLIALVNRKIVTKDSSTVSVRLLLTRYDADEDKGDGIILLARSGYMSHNQLEGRGCIIIFACIRVACMRYDSEIEVTPYTSCRSAFPPACSDYARDGPCASWRCL
jgi:hypothetical protein